MPNPLYLFALQRLDEQIKRGKRTPVSTTYRPTTLTGVTAAGMIFPVQGGTFSKGWGAPRNGRKHQGVDIFAAKGTPIVAPANGTVQNTSGDLSGLAVRFFDGQGNKYFMGHLDGFIGNLGDKRQVKAGEVIGYVGNTGNARGSSPHVHFQYHPGGARAVDPYGLLTSWKEGTSYTPEQSPGRLLGTFESTAYHGSEPGGGGFTTATGTKVGPGQVAVDPKVIPLGTKLYVEGYGECVATDVGGAIKGNKVDVWKPSVQAANEWGRRPARVWILGEGAKGAKLEYGEPVTERTTKREPDYYAQYLRKLVESEMTKEDVGTTMEAQRLYRRVRQEESAAPLSAYQERLEELREQQRKREGRIVRGGMYGF